MTTSKKYLYDITENPNHAASKIFGLVDGSKMLLERLGCTVTGIEIDPIAAEDARPYCEHLIIGSIETLDLAKELRDRRFDAITFADVLEHLYDPAETLKKVRAFLSEDGHLIASIPNIAHAAICWEIAHGRFDYRKFGLLDNTHIRFFTKRNVALLFEEAGYQIVSWDRVTKSPQETEFGVHCNSPQDQSFLDWISEKNLEANTYQFIVKARPLRNGAHESSNQRLEALNTIHQLETRVGELEHHNSKLRSQIQWLESHRFGRFSSLINKLLANR
jgi:SAM-dependent methyltransferase